MSSSRYQRTQERLIECALELFEAQGFEQTTVAQIAAAAGVSEMTFFRHFSAKERAVLTDPYDPAIAGAIGARPAGEPPVVRTVRGIRQALKGLSEPESDLVRRRVAIMANSPALRIASAEANAATEQRIADELLAGGAPRLAARAAAAAVMAALTSALLEWAGDESLTMRSAIEIALHTVENRDD